MRHPLVHRDTVPLATPKVTVLTDRCAGCQECLVRCPTEALDLTESSWVIVADQVKCVGCRQCVRTCPFSAITVEGPCLVDPRTELVRSEPASLRGDLSETRRGITDWADALEEAARCLGCPDPTCVRGCPAHNDIPGFIAALSDGELARAHQILRRTSFLPDVCSRVCDQAVQCEGSCTWSLAGGQPVAIGALERFVADHHPCPPLTPSSRGADGLRVAIVGSGPAGLAAASYLVQSGASVCVFERDAEAGGLLRWGIPDFTLPAKVVDRAVSAAIDAGVEFRFGVEVDLSHLEVLTAEYDAVIVAAGAAQQITLPVPGIDLECVWGSTRFLTEGRAAVAAGDRLDALRVRGSREPRVVVLGAGNTAMDVARMARRMGAAADCVDWMDRRYAPVRPDEIAEAEAEGVTVRFTTTVDHIRSEPDGGCAVCLSRTEQSGPTERPHVVAPAWLTIPADLVVLAMGYRVDGDVAAAGSVPVAKAVPTLADRRWVASGIMANPAPPFARHQPVGRLALAREDGRITATQPRRSNVWFAGDALIGPSTVVEAMAQGRAAAVAVVAARSAGLR